MRVVKSASQGFHLPRTRIIQFKKAIWHVIFRSFISGCPAKITIFLLISDASSTRIISFRRWLGDRSITEWTVRSKMDQASLWKQIMTDVDGRSDKKRFGALHLKQRKRTNPRMRLIRRAKKSRVAFVVTGLYHSSLGSGKVLCTDMRSLTYWLNAFFCQPSSMTFLVLASGFSILKGLPNSPGPLGSGGSGITPTSCRSASFFHLRI